MGPKKGNSQPQKQPLEPHESVSMKDFKPLKKPDLKPHESAPTNNIIFDIETTGLSRTEDEITQIAAITTDLKHEFNIYILPTIEIPKAAAELTGLSIVSRNGTRYMVRHKRKVETVTLQTGIESFIKFLKERKESNGLINLLGHCCIKFDMTFIYQALKKTNLVDEFQNIKVGITDTLDVFKKALPEMESYKQPDLYRKVFQDEYKAHDALNDVKALARLMLEVEEYDARPHTYSYASVIERITFNIGTRERVQSLDVLVTKKVISKYMARKMAEIGINFDHLKKAYGEDKDNGLGLLLSTANEDGKPTVTNREKIITKLHDYFKNPGEGA